QGQDDSYIDAANDSIHVTMPYGTTDLSALIADFTISTAATAAVGVTAQVSGTTLNDWSTSPVVYDVTAEDGVTVRNWSVYVDVATSSEAEVLTYAIQGQDDSYIDAANDSIHVTMPYGTTDFSALIADFTISTAATAAVGVTAQVSGITPNDWSTSPVVYDVTAEDGITVRNWSVYVDVATGINNVINSTDVTVYPNPNNGKFNIALNLNVNTVNMKVVNMQGQVVANFNNIEANSTQSVELSNVAEGIYYIRISSENEAIIKKVNVIK
ncbi:MAG: T9SS type A sorting domain-containing protein, partial [Salinivirgaceae bacterium]|nr:T9SS type A sorting domain-containing protein [Salinivirgaceae bacterium]